MALNDPRGQFGVHSACFYNLTTGLPIVMLRVLKDTGLDFSAEFEDLEGGSNQFIWDSEVTSINSDFKLTCMEYPGEAMELFLGGSLVTNAAEAAGAVDGYANLNGTSILDPSTGIDVVELTAADSADLKEGKYIIIATAAAAVSLYGASDVDFQRGTDLSFTDDTLLIESGIDLSSADAVIEELGITLSKAGVTAFVTGDTAVFYIRKPNTTSIELEFGQSGAEFQQVGLFMAGQRQSDGTITTMELYRVIGAGMPLSMNSKSWSEWEVTIKALHDSARNKVGTYRRTVAA